MHVICFLFLLVSTVLEYHCQRIKSKLSTWYTKCFRVQSSFSCHVIIHRTLDSNITYHLHFPTFSLTPPTSAFLLFVPQTCSPWWIPIHSSRLIASYLIQEYFIHFSKQSKVSSSMLSQYHLLITLTYQSLFYFSVCMIRLQKIMKGRKCGL